MAGQQVGSPLMPGSGLLSTTGKTTLFPAETRVLYQRVSIADNTIQTTLGMQLPARSKIVWANLVNVSAVAVDGSDATGTADTYALFNNGTTTALATSTVSNATVSVVISAATGNLASNGVTPVCPGLSTNDASAKFINTSTSPQYLILAPLSSTGNRVNPGTGVTAATDGYKFNGTAQVDVTVYFQSFSDQYATVTS